MHVRTLHHVIWPKLFTRIQATEISSSKESTILNRSVYTNIICKRKHLCYLYHLNTLIRIAAVLMSFDNVYDAESAQLRLFFFFFLNMWFIMTCTMYIVSITKQRMIKKIRVTLIIQFQYLRYTFQCLRYTF